MRKIHHTIKEISEICLNESVYGGMGIGNATPPPPKPQITSTETDFFGNKASLLGWKAAYADVVGGSWYTFVYEGGNWGLYR